jgi:hypothetical protein
MRLDGKHAGDRLWLAIAVAVLTLAALMTPSSEQLALFGFDIPELCTFRRLTGWSCPGCGLTRSFVFLAHGQPVEAVRMNLLGLPLFVALTAQIPMRLVRLWRARAASGPQEPVAGEGGERGVP